MSPLTKLSKKEHKNFQANGHISPLDNYLACPLRIVKYDLKGLYS